LPPAPPLVAPTPPKLAPAPKGRKRQTEAVTVRKRREKTAAVAAATGGQVYYQQGTGISTLSSVKFFHLSPTQLQQLIDYAKREFKARPC
jgi:hypothetical protein